MLPVITQVAAALCCAGLGGGTAVAGAHGDAVAPANQVQIFAPAAGGGGTVALGGGGETVAPAGPVQVFTPSAGATTPSQTDVPQPDGQTSGGGTVATGGSAPETTIPVNPFPGWTTAGPSSGNPGGVMPHSPVNDPSGSNPPTAWSPLGE